MAKMILPLNATHSIVVNNGTSRAFVFNADGSISVAGNATFGNSTNAFTAILNAANITTSNKTFTLNNRTGTLALEDATSLAAMLPSQTGQDGKYLQTNAGVLSWAAASGASSLTSFNGISASTYQTQTLATPGISGTAPNWVSVLSNTNTHTLNIPLAATASVTAGLMSNADYLNIPFKNAGNTFAGIQVFTNSPQITTPTTGTNDVATYGQVLAARNGIGIRLPVAAMDSVSTSLGTNNPTIDGYVVQIGDRILATALTVSPNKIYKATGTLSAITWTVETDGQAGTGVPTTGDILFIKNGTAYADQQWSYEGSSWVLYNISSAYTFSTGLTLTGTTVTVNYGSTGTTACVGNDARLSDSRTPTAHQFDGALHTISGKTAGQVLLATAATTFGFVTISQDLTISATGVAAIAKVNNVGINDLGLQQNVATLIDNTVGATPVTGCSWAIANYRAIKFDYTISRGAGNYTVGSITILHDGTTPQVIVTEDGSIGAAHGVTFSTDINTGNVRLLYTTTSTGVNATLKFINFSIPV